MLSQEILIDKIKGTIYGAALGDGFGLSTEFMNKAKARHHYGLGPIKFGEAEGFKFVRDRHRGRWHENDFTDDTDQLLLILKTILKNKGVLVPKDFALELSEWLQNGFPELNNKTPCGIGMTVGRVIHDPEFLEDPHKSAFRVWSDSGRNLAANGAVMRTSVLGIPFYENEMKVVKNSIAAAKVTHADPRSIISSVIISILISKILSGNMEIENFSSSSEKEKIIQLLENGSESETSKKSSLSSRLLERMSSLFSSSKNSPTPASISQEPPKGWNIPKYPKYTVEEMKELDEPDPIPTNPEQIPLHMDTFEIDQDLYKLAQEIVSKYEFIVKSNSLCPAANKENDKPWAEQLNEHCFPKSLIDLNLEETSSMGYCFKALGSGIFCLTRAIPKGMSESDFFKTLITQVTLEGGDSDTNCAVVGSLLGCRLGYKALPNEWKNGLRNSEYLDLQIKLLIDLVLSL